MRYHPDVPIEVPAEPAGGDEDGRCSHCSGIGAVGDDCCPACGGVGSAEGQVIVAKAAEVDRLTREVERLTEARDTWRAFNDRLRKVLGVALGEDAIAEVERLMREVELLRRTVDETEELDPHGVGLDTVIASLRSDLAAARDEARTDRGVLYKDMASDLIDQRDTCLARAEKAEAELKDADEALAAQPGDALVADPRPDENEGMPDHG